MSCAIDHPRHLYVAFHSFSLQQNNVSIIWTADLGFLEYVILCHEGKYCERDYKKEKQQKFYIGGNTD
jgi:hypothetical protein